MILQRGLLISHRKIGNTLQAQGDLSGALAAYRTSMGIAKQLVSRDSSNTTWQHDVAVSHESVGGVLRAQGQLAEAAAAFRASMGIVEKLVSRDPSNVEWKQDLARLRQTMATRR